MTWWNRPGFKDYDGIICDGSIRSGKTVAMTVGFVMWAMTNFDGQNFALCGKTIESLRRNVTSNLPTWLAGVFSFKEHRTENKIVVTANGKSNNFYLFGGKDESSASLIQGITLAGILLDEVALMPRSFVEQACARCSVEGSKLWFNCNPEGPSHWFYLTWVLGAKERNMLHLHFTISGDQCHHWAELVRPIRQKASNWRRNDGNRAAVLREAKAAQELAKMSQMASQIAEALARTT